MVKLRTYNTEGVAVTRTVMLFLYARAEGALNGFKLGTRAATYPDWSWVTAWVVSQVCQHYFGR